MFGLTSIEFFLFGKQLGLALAGAASLWGFVFCSLVKHEKTKRCIVYQWVGERLLAPFFIGVFVAGISWFILSFLTPVYGHEGIVLVPTALQIVTAITATHWIFVTWIITALAGIIVLKAKPLFAYKHASAFYILQFVLAAVLISLSVISGEFDKVQLFFIGHSVHSIFTVGTVLILDFLFLISKSSNILKQHIYPLFPGISKVIWIGLAVDFVSVALVFDEAIRLTPKFFFMQTVIAILIMNGAFLSGPITDRILASVRRGGVAMARQWTLLGDLAGTISVVSWLSITFVDFFHHLTLSYIQLLGIYLGVIVLGFLGHILWEYARHDTFVERVL